MARFHTKENGDPGVCVAQPGNCPLGPNEPHFGSPGEVRRYSEKKLSEAYDDVLVGIREGVDMRTITDWGAPELKGAIKEVTYKGNTGWVHTDYVK